MKAYTIGFVFDSSMEKVLLIHKNRPEWQKGKMNGPGGKLNESETPQAGIAREMREEAGLSILPEKWMLVGEIGNPEWNVKILTTHYHGDSNHASAQTDEKIEWVDVKNIPVNAIPNLRWIIPLCHEKIQHREMKYAKVDYD